MQAMNNPTVLIIDDNEGDVHLLQYAAQAESRFQVASVLTGKDAVAYLGSHSEPALVVSDYFLGVEDGFQVLQDLRRTADLHCPVALLTGCLGPEVEKIAARFGLPCFEKPMHLEGWFILAVQLSELSAPA